MKDRMFPKTSLVFVLLFSTCINGLAQNLITNPGAELTPAGSSIVVFNKTESGNFMLSPNPAAKEVIVTGLRPNGTIIVRAMNGIIVFNSRVDAKSILVDVSWLSKGSYMVSYSDMNSTKTKQLIVQ
ncbi:MAG TPA: T9SS type A sorting domain-containing protein [Puia sp.]|jgi:hypothetical protein